MKITMDMTEVNQAVYEWLQSHYPHLPLSDIQPIYEVDGTWEDRTNILIGYEATVVPKENEMAPRS